MHKLTIFGSAMVFPWIWELCQLLVTKYLVYLGFLLAYGMVMKALAGKEHNDSDTDENDSSTSKPITSMEITTANVDAFQETSARLEIFQSF